MLDIVCVTSRALPPVATDHRQGRDGHRHRHSPTNYPNTRSTVVYEFTDMTMLANKNVNTLGTTSTKHPNSPQATITHFYDRD